MGLQLLGNFLDHRIVDESIGRKFAAWGFFRQKVDFRYINVQGIVRVEEQTVYDLAGKNHLLKLKIYGKILL